MRLDDRASGGKKEGRRRLKHAIPEGPASDVEAGLLGRKTAELQNRAIGFDREKKMGWRQNPRSQWALSGRGDPDVDAWIAETVLDAVTRLGSHLDPEELASMTESLFDLLTSDPYLIVLRLRLGFGRRAAN